MNITVHGVLAGAYLRSSLQYGRALLTHASSDGGATALCKRVKQFNLCDAIEPGAPTCSTCAKRAKAL